MLKSQLEHIIRAATALTNQYEVIVVGSQSILGSVETPPPECLISMEADLIVPGNEALWNLIDGAIGEGSPFDDSFGYYAQGVDSTTCKFPAGWKDRLVRMQNESTNGKIGYCLEVVDLFLAKCAANREKDRYFNTILLANGIVDVQAALSRLDSMQLGSEERDRIRASIWRMDAAAHPPPPAPPVQGQGT